MVAPTKKHVTFVIGGEKVDVPELSWAVLELDVLPLIDSLNSEEDRLMLQELREREAEMESLIQANSPQKELLEQELIKNRAEQAKRMPRWYVARGADIKILAAALRRVRPDLTLDEIRERLNFEEARAVSEKMADLLAISGFGESGEAQEAVGSTATSTASSPNSSPEESLTSASGTK